MDPASGTVAAFAVLAALRRREKTGVGEVIELAQSENLLQHIGEEILDASVVGSIGSGSETATPRLLHKVCIRAPVRIVGLRSP